MPVLEWMQPRSRDTAARMIATLSAVAGIVTLAFLPIAPHSRTPTSFGLVIVAVTAAFVVVLSLLAHLLKEATPLAWALCPLLALGVILELDYVTRDASVAAQIFLFFPTLYGASQLRRAGAVVMTSASVLGEILIAGTLPWHEAATDIGYVAAALVTTSVLLFRGAERHEALVAKLRAQAAIDPLTGLVTRWVLDEAAKSAMSGAASKLGTSLMVIDVDDFKSINDRYGHPAGDTVLMQLAGLLTSLARTDDVISRMGGDEIAVLLPGCSAATARERADHVVAIVGSHAFDVGGTDMARVSVSVGFAHAPTDASELRTLYVAADAALYEAKRSGRDRAASPADIAARTHPPLKAPDLAAR
jgi:diguanylate cyclase (GGDEF)-like protein